MARMSEFTFLSSDGQTALSAREYLPEGDPVGIVQIVHGIAEHIARYDAFAAFLAEHGYIVVLHDQLGHGKSAPDEAHLGFFSEENGWEKAVQDIRSLHDKTAAKYPGKPYFIFGHSMGSFLLRTYLYMYPGELSGAIISGTGWQPEAALRAGLALCRLEQLRIGETGCSKLLKELMFGAYNKKFRPNRTPNDWICSDPAVVDAYTNDELCGFDATVGLTRDMLTGISMNQKKENLAKMDKELPVLFISGMQDPVGAMGEGVLACIDAFKRAGIRHVTIRLYPEGRHEMLNEVNRTEVYADILSWLEQRI